MSVKVESPYFTLMCEFEVDATFSEYIDYISREEAQEAEKKEFGKGKHQEVSSLNEIQYRHKDSKVSVKEEQFFKYIDYIDRQGALTSKSKLSKEELKSLEVIGKENGKMIEMLKQMKDSPMKMEQKKLQTGLFDFSKDDLSETEKNEYKKKFDEAQKNNSVLFKDVISFDTNALILAGIYNPYTNELNRQPLIEASRRMLKQMYKDEGLEQTAISLGEIHYNTHHFHIHFATVETQNTRSDVLNPETGQIEPRGMRKESTLQHMKSTFANYIFDRSEELERISFLRDTLRDEIKKELRLSGNEKSILYLTELKNNLPEDKRKWNSKNLSKENQDTMRKLVDELMKKNPGFEKYKELAKEENDFKIQTYGKLPKGQTSFYEGRMEGREGIYYRLSNSVLEELRKDSSRVENNKGILKIEFSKHSLDKKQESDFIIKPYSELSRQQITLNKKSDTKEYQQKNEQFIEGKREFIKTRSIANQLKNLERRTNNEFEKYKAEMENYKIARAIQQAQYEQSLE